MGNWHKLKDRRRINSDVIMKVYIKDIAYYLPTKVITNEQLVQEFPEWSVEKIVDKVGIKERHVAAEDETAMDMAVSAAEVLFQQGKCQKEDIDFVLLCTQSPDYFLPSSSCLVQSRLGLRKDIGALDYNLGCSGYVYGISLAKGLVVAGIAKNVLLLTSETYNKHLHPRDKGNRSIFGDGASATVISDNGIAEIGEFQLGTNGEGANNLILKTGGMRHPDRANDLSYDEKNGNPLSSDYLFMDGSEIFAFTLTHVPKLIKKVLAKNDMEQKDVDLFVLHQANKYMLDFLKKKCKIEDDKFYYCIENVGNTVSSSIPIALVEAMKEGRVKEQQKVLIAGFGVGYSWAGTMLKF